ncbi:unnamed protein product [Strongylus vulgaris]|uniref:Uncharacterized protein n=1 Tax=Strongylus vulgaris TaxID=40348 RepID=A0A3P7K3K6_STRVU|nr:unnamed protein product [Strongylus vulgaris]
MSGGVAAASPGNDVPGPSNSRSDFMGMSPREVPIPQQPEHRLSRIECIHSTLQGLYEEWETRKKAIFNVEYTNPSLLCSSSSDPVSCLELGGLGERRHLTVVLPWLQVNVCCGFEYSLASLKAELFDSLKR